MRGRVFDQYATAGGHLVQWRYVRPENDPHGGGVQAECTGCPAVHGPANQSTIYDWTQQHAVECGARVKARAA